jgi:hypothetical protein
VLARVTLRGKLDKESAAQLFSLTFSFPFLFLMKRLIYPALLGLALVGCSQANTKEDATMQDAVAASAQPMPVPTAERNAPTPLPTTDAQVAQSPGKAVVYEGKLDLAVDDFNQATTTINRLLEENDAYLSTAHETRADGQQRQEMIIKIPPAKFVSVVTALGQLGRVENKDVASADMTADVLQTNARITAKQATEAKYQQLLKHMTNPTEVRQLEEQTRQLQLDLSADQARLQAFGARSTWATLALRYYQILPTTELTTPLPAFGPQFQAAFNRGWSFILEIAVTLTNFWPLWLLGGIGAWGVRRWRQRHLAEA